MGAYCFEDSKDKAYLTDIFKSTKVTVNIDYPSDAGNGVFSRFYSFDNHAGYKPIMAYAASQYGGDDGRGFYITGVTIGHVTQVNPGEPFGVNLAISYRKNYTPDAGRIEGKEITIIWVREDILGTF